MPAEQQSYLKLSGCTTIENLDDEAEFNTMSEAMEAVGMDVGEQMDVARCVAVVLALGQIRFQEECGTSGEMQVPSLRLKLCMTYGVWRIGHTQRVWGAGGYSGRGGQRRSSRCADAHWCA
jgi:myosin heavy subunit